jgi:tRNA (cytidine/uridine-2'-O-)-methyltransferase
MGLEGEKTEGFVVRSAESIWGSVSDQNLHVALVHPEIPGNTGNIGRLCAGANIWLHLVRPLGFELNNKYLRRAGLDYWPSVKLCIHDSLEDLVERFPTEKIHLFSKKAGRLYTEVEYRPGALLLFGCETRGLPDDFLTRFGDRALRIPTTEKVRSLNLSNACSIVIYEAMRQLDWTPIEGEC